jgi:hypothetical protein
MEHGSESVRQSRLENRGRLVSDTRNLKERFPACRLTLHSSTTTTAWGRQSDDSVRRYFRADCVAESR